MDIIVRKSGGAEIVSIPKAIGKAAGIKAGTVLSLSVKDNQIILSPKHSTTVEELLAGCSPEMFALTDEDKQWVGDSPKGLEL
ncbi:MAG: AbrB/MazE/SpoVT family DNA-binding domain-containing protein [Gammaproteobacteria bacterium]|jgi:antitoxin component of MazEF toxin-antitoxin module|nr:AbrB/MazE/SpoVT family DNA-binding domain-containing protein [Gammaproteobacteria bacterium]